jgi:ubiquinone/menaquinone biosynthesis C-methylase UbiE
MEIDSKERFSGRAEVYAKHRPQYPQEAIERIFSETSARTIADVGSGTGKLTRLLLAKGAKTYAVEPNKSMRGEAEKELSGEPGFVSIDGSAEDTSLPDGSVDLVTAAQAFHWFDKEKCKAEFKRILKPGGQCALIWNSRTSSTEFLKGYQEAMDRLKGDFALVSHGKATDEKSLDLFFDAGRKSFSYRWSSPASFESVWGRALSSSYSPAPGHPNHEPLKSAIADLFEKHQKDGFVEWEYETSLIIGAFSA